MTQLLADPPISAHRTRPTVVGELVDLSLRALEQMYLPQQRRFAYCLRRKADGDRLEGESRRYTAISAIGLAAALNDDRNSELHHRLGGDAPVDADTPLTALHGASLNDVVGGLLSDVEQVDNVGDVALTLWAACSSDHDEVDRALQRLTDMRPWACDCPTVDLAWAVTALGHAYDDSEPESDPLQATADRLKRSFNPTSKLFPHWPVGSRPARFRGHVCCFADLVYPTQALSIYHATTGDADARSIATQCGQRMCDLQGPDGQWWWHFDVRTGRVIEGYPVYAVHQDSMAPMALLDLADACDVDHRSSIEKGLDWLEVPRECRRSLIDRAKGLVWRKVARREPNKLARSIQAMASCLHPSMRAPGLGLIFRPGWIDWESRPYHFGWILYAWCNRNSPL